MLGVSAKGARRELSPAWTVDVDDYPTSLALAPDGSFGAIGTSAGVVVAFDATRGRRLWSAAASAGGVLDVSASGRLVAAGGQGGATALFTREGEKVAELAGGAAWVEHVAFSPDGGRLATAAGKRLRIWSDGGAPILESQAHPSTVTGLEWRRDGGELATVCYGGAYLWPTVSGAHPRHLPFAGSLVSLARSPDGEVIACASQDCSVQFWRLADGKGSQMTGFPFKPKALAWDARSSLLATGGDASPCVWSFEKKGPEGTRPIQLSAHAGQVTHLAWHPRKGLLASAAQDMGLIVWSPRESRTPLAFAFARDTIEALAWCPGGEALIAADASGTVSAWKVPT
jgi:WD40 repeat protein